MKKLLTFATLAIVASGLGAQELVVLSKNDVNLRENPSTTAPVVAKGKKGAILELKEKKSGWYLASNPQFGADPVWVATSVAKEVPEYSADKPAISLVNLPDGCIPYTKRNTFKGGEETITWNFYSEESNFWQDEKPGSPILATKSDAIIRTNGSMQTVETYYKGVYQPTYLLLTEEKSQFSDSFAPLEKPIYVYNSSVLDGASGIFIDGEIYTDDDVLDGDW